jgi:hypothetical protein
VRRQRNPSLARSRKIKPKPFLPLVGDNTLFEAALLRCDGQADFGPAMIVTGAAHLDHVTEQLIDPEHTGIIIEPEGKNTAAAIALAALRLPADAIMLVCPSDHHIGDVAAFQSAARAAAALAAKDWLVAFGIAATAPETGYGYLKQGEAIPTARATASNASSRSPISPVRAPSWPMAAIRGTAASSPSAPVTSSMNWPGTALRWPPPCAPRSNRAPSMATSSTPIRSLSARSKGNRSTTR